MGKIIAQGDQVTLHFRLSLESGFIVEDTWNDEPLQITIGDGALIEGLEKEILGLRSGDRKDVWLGPDQAFGFRDEERIMQMSRDEFPSEIELETGKIIGFATPSGEEVAGSVLIIDDNQITVDFNHPLAGKRIEFELEIVAIT